VPTPTPRRLLPIVLAYLPVPLAGAALSAAWNVGASPGGDSGDMFLRGTALTPPLFLPAALLAGAAAARRRGRAGRAGAGIVTLVGAAFFAVSTANLPNDFAAARAAGSPPVLTAALAAVHIVLSVGLLYNAVPALLGVGATHESGAAPA